MAYQFPMEGMMGPSSPVTGIPTAKSSAFNPVNQAAGSGFENLLNALGAAGAEAKKGAGKAYEKVGGTRAIAGRYMPLAGGVLSLLGDPTNIGGAAGTGLGGMLGAGLGAAVGGPLAPVTSLVGSALGSAVGGGLGTAAQGLLVGGAKAAMGIPGALAGQEREAGRSPGILPGTGTGIGFSDSDVQRIAELSRITGQSQVEIARQMLPITNEFRNAEMQRQMQLNQQTGQLTGALNRQLYTAQLAQGAQTEAGATTRTMMTAANPYAQSAFQYRG